MFVSIEDGYPVSQGCVCSPFANKCFSPLIICFFANVGHLFIRFRKKQVGHVCSVLMQKTSDIDVSVVPSVHDLFRKWNKYIRVSPRVLLLPFWCCFRGWHGWCRYFWMSMMCCFSKTVFEFRIQNSYVLDCGVVEKSNRYQFIWIPRLFGLELAELQVFVTFGFLLCVDCRRSWYLLYDRKKCGSTVKFVLPQTLLLLILETFCFAISLSFNL